MNLRAPGPPDRPLEAGPQPPCLLALEVVDRARLALTFGPQPNVRSGVEASVPSHAARERLHAKGSRDEDVKRRLLLVPCRRLRQEPALLLRCLEE